METFGQRIRQLRMKKGLTQSQLAEGIITPSMQSQIESDKARASWHVLEKLAQKLEISVEELIGNSQMNMVLVSEYRLAKGMLSAGEFSSALLLLEKVMRENNGKLDLFELRYDYAKCLLELHRFREAEETFQQLLEHANSNSGSPILAIRVLHQLGRIELKQKRHQLAEHYISLALAKLQATGLKDVHLQCSLLLMLVEIQRQSRQLRKAIVSFQLALPILEERENIQGLGNLYMKLAQSAHDADDYQQATDYSQRALWCFETVNSQSEKLALEVRLTVLQAEMGNGDNVITDLGSDRRGAQKVGARRTNGDCFI